MARLVLVQPPHRDTFGYSMPPVGLLHAAAGARAAGHDVRFLDFALMLRRGELPVATPADADRLTLRCAERIAHERPDAVGIGAMLSSMPMTLDLAAHIRRRLPHAPLILGGQGPEQVEEAILARHPAVDAVAVGEADHTLAEWLDAACGPVAPVRDARPAVTAGTVVGSDRARVSGQPAVLHALRHASGLAVDLVPFSGVESAERRIAWPPRGEFVMDVFGFQEAQATSHSIQLPGNVPAKLISLPALAILKLVTWKDRHFSAPRKDAHDLMLIIGEYLALGNEDRLWSEFADWAAAEDFDYEVAGARMLGRDMLASLDGRGVERIGTILAAEADEESPGILANAMRPTNPDGVRKLLAALYQGLLGT